MARASVGRFRLFLLAMEASVLVLLLLVPVLLPPVYQIVDPVGGVVGGLSLDLPEDVYLEVAGLDGKAKVYMDDYGVPHIIADSENAAFYAIGWTQASLRLFQMDVFRRVALGELSGLLGEAALEVDRTSLTLGFRDSSVATWEYIKSAEEYSELARAIEWYTRGVNDYINYAVENGLLPAEYRLLGVMPSKWHPVDSIALSKFFHLMLSYSTDDLVLQKLVKRNGYDLIVDLDVVERNLNLSHAICYEAVTWGEITGMDGPFDPDIEESIVSEPLHGAPVELNTGPGLVNGVEHAIMLSEKLVSVLSPGYMEASNNWVISGVYTESGKPMLANDPHLQLTAPSLWLFMRVSSPGYNVAGVFLPGVPLVVIGRNSNVAWGFTNVGSDFTDFYYYDWLDEKRYIYKGEVMEVEAREYKVYVWDPAGRSYREEAVTIEYTIHGPLIEWEGEKYAVAYTGRGPTFEVIFLWLLNKADNVVEALQAQRFFYGPPQNMVIADRDGNIAYSPVGAYPLRSNTPLIVTRYGGIVNTGFLPFNGSEGEGEWKGYRDYSEIPILYNPPSGYVATANSRPFDLECWEGFGWNYADRFRTQRIYSLLEQASRDGAISIRENMKIQTDTRDLGLERMATLLLALLEKAGVSNEYTSTIESWLPSPSTGETSTGATLVLLSSWFFAQEVWKELYGSYSDWRFLKVEHIEVLVNSYLEGEVWIEKYFEDGELEEIAVEALRKAVATATEYFGSDDPEDWFYGKIHYYNPDHVISSVLGFDERPAPGGPFSVNVAPPSEITSSRGAPVSAGPSVRIVVDLSESSIYFSLPGGPSGVPFSPFYQNLYRETWLKGQYVEVEIYGEPDARLLLSVTPAG
ncbi:MAG: penicillin acylase family protein [Aeropyrum sp.]|nr:penicillin acylase family protein [Aeropyrum sp.]